MTTPPGLENVGSAAAGRDETVLEAVLEAVAVVVDDLVAADVDERVLEHVAEAVAVAVVDARHDHAWPAS